MRILNLDSPMLVPGFLELGHEVFCVGFQDDADIRVTSPRSALEVFTRVCATGFVPDCVFWCDSSNLPYLYGVEKLPCATAHYSIDTYCQHWHFSFAYAFDAVFVAQKDHVPLFPAHEIAVRWLPLFAREASAWGSEGERDIPVSFVGTRKHKNNPDREPFLRRFRALHPLFIHSGRFEEIFSRSRIALNQTACSEVNFRCFEAMACGAALLMEYCGHGLTELFTPGETILPLYRRNSWREAAAIAERALADPDRLAAVADAGRAHVLQNHMARHRAAQAVAVMEECIRGEAPQRRQRDLDRRGPFVAAAYAMLGHDLEGRLDAAYTDFYYSLSAAMLPGTKNIQ